MILVDVFVPSIDKKYDFRLNEEVPVQLVIEEIAEMIGQKEHTKLIGSVDQLLLCESFGGHVLDRKLSLYENEIKTGTSLILV